MWPQYSKLETDLQHSFFYAVSLQVLKERTFLMSDPLPLVWWSWRKYVSRKAFPEEKEHLWFRLQWKCCSWFSGLKICFSVNFLTFCLYSIVYLRLLTVKFLYDVKTIVVSVKLWLYFISYLYINFVWAGTYLSTPALENKLSNRIPQG